LGSYVLLVHLAQFRIKAKVAFIRTNDEKEFIF
jgi:hypothetical protein